MDRTTQFNIGMTNRKLNIQIKKNRADIIYKKTTALARLNIK